MKVPLGRDGWYLCDWADRPNFAFEQVPAGAELALHWLSQFRSDFDTVAGLRRLFVDGFYRDEEMLQQVAGRLARGTWRARRRLPDRIETAPMLGDAVAAAFPLEERRRAASPVATPAPDPPPFPPDADLLAIAAAQREAAARGVPFCEECLKAKLGAVAPEAKRPAPSDFSPDADLEVIATAQRAAAAEGAPFCEECLKEQSGAGR